MAVDESSGPASSKQHNSDCTWCAALPCPGKPELFRLYDSGLPGSFPSNITDAIKICKELQKPSRNHWTNQPLKYRISMQYEPRSLYDKVQKNALFQLGPIHAHLVTKEEERTSL